MTQADLPWRPHDRLPYRVLAVDENDELVDTAWLFARAMPPAQEAIGIYCYIYVSQLPHFYMLAVVLGMVYGGVMPLYSVLIRENFPLRMLGTIMGGTGMAGGLGMATGPVLGGWIFDTTGDYGWLYIACFGMGIGAVLIAMLFRPFPVQQKPETAAA